MAYFDQFPRIVYSNTECSDLTRRVRFDEKTRDALTLYYIYEVKDGLRADLIADAYYENPSLDWLLWLTNDTVDPYSQWNLSETDFQQYLVTKYGSVEISLERIAFYRNNWYDDDNVVTTDFYNNVLQETWKKYYSPVYGPNLKILYWKRREDDWTMETNEIWKCTKVDGANVAIGDLIVMGVTSASPGIIVSTSTFNGEISAIDDDVIYIKNVAYTTNAEQLDTITPASNTIHFTQITGMELVYRAIELDEAVFWSPVAYYDIENERNVYNQSIKIMDRSQLLNVTDQVRKKLNE